MKASPRLALLAVLFTGLLVRAIAFDHGLPQRYVDDTHIVRGALGMAADKDLAPPAKKYTTYPYLLPYLLLPEYAALYVGGKATGAWNSAAEFGARTIDDPTAVYLVARGLLLLFGVLGVYLAWRVGRRAGGDHIGLLAAWLTATSFLVVHLGKDARPWTPLATLVLFTADRALVWLERPTALRALMMGGAAGLCMACHQAGGMAALIVAGAALDRLRADPRRALGAGALAAGAFGLVFLCVGIPYVLRGHSAAVPVGTGGVAGGIDLGGQTFDPARLGLARATDVVLGFLAAEPALLLLVVIGAVGAVRELRRRGVLATFALYPAAVVPFFVCYSGAHVRYLSPAVPMLAVFAAFGALVLWKTIPGRLFAGLLLLLPLAQALRYDLVLSRTDTRTEMLDRVARMVPANARIAVDFWGPPLRFSADAKKLLVARDVPLSRAEDRQADDLAPRLPDRPPFTVIPLERFFDSNEFIAERYSGAGGPKTIESLLDELNVDWVVTVERTPATPRPSALRELMRRRGEKVAEILPYAGSPPPETHLPMDPARAFFAIWTVERPGPALALWKLQR